MTKRFGFTLAEVLITLGIIGVVAAMTMPTLMNSTQGAQYKAAYKKALSALSQAVTLNVALDEWSFADADNSVYKLEDMFNNRMNVVRQETGATNIKDSKGNEYKVAISTAGKLQGVTGTSLSIDGTNTTLFFNDGIMFTYTPTQATACTKADGAAQKLCYGFIDVNGVKAPNRIVQCDNSDASTTKCEVKNPTVFYDQTVLPNSTPARAVLYSK
mgnify:CR=1 FL=1